MSLYVLGCDNPGGACLGEDVPPPPWTRLRDGAEVRLREATASDAPLLRELFFTLSDVTRYLYFRAGVPAQERWAERVVALGVADGTASYALVAEVGGEVVGVARFDRDPRSNFAEIGILLTDTWQSRGLGHEVVVRLRHAAGQRALAGFTGVTLGENRRALRLLRRAFPQMRATLSYGQYELTMPFAS